MKKKIENKKGSVVLIGAGCGSGLITVEGLNALKRAETVVYDDLIDSGLLSEAPDQAEQIFVGKRYGVHSEKQEEINKILIQKASEGKNVVRLKGGDSFVFGRGGEEYEAVSGAGLSCRVIPGVSSCIAVPEHAGIPVTHRGLSRSFTVVTGHTADDTGENFAALARLKGTLVFLMGLHSCRRISDELIKNGMPGNTPASIISCGFSSDEKRFDTTLGCLPLAAEKAGTPAVIVIGETASMHFSDRCRFDSFHGSSPGENETNFSLRNNFAEENEPACCAPLSGVSITVTGTENFTEKTAAKLRNCGAQVRALVTVKIIPCGSLYPDDTGRFSWTVFTSSNGVRIWADKFKEAGFDIRTLAKMRFACIGKGTADTLKSFGIKADFIPSAYTSEILGKELSEHILNKARSNKSEHMTMQKKDKQRVLILRASSGSAALTDELSKAGIDFEDRAIYSPVPAGTLPESVPDSDYLVFGSAGGAEALAGLLDKIPEHVRYVCIGKFTYEKLKQYTNRDIITADTYTSSGIVDAVLDAEHRQPRSNR